MLKCSSDSSQSTRWQVGIGENIHNQHSSNAHGKVDSKGEINITDQLSSAVLEYMAARKKGVYNRVPTGIIDTFKLVWCFLGIIINITSGFALSDAPLWNVYSASKVSEIMKRKLIFSTYSELCIALIANTSKWIFILRDHHSNTYANESIYKIAYTKSRPILFYFRIMFLLRWTSHRSSFLLQRIMRDLHWRQSELLMKQPDIAHINCRYTYCWLKGYNLATIYLDCFQSISAVVSVPSNCKEIYSQDSQIHSKWFGSKCKSMTVN